MFFYISLETKQKHELIEILITYIRYVQSVRFSSQESPYSYSYNLCCFNNNNLVMSCAVRSFISQY